MSSNTLMWVALIAIVVVVMLMANRRPSLVGKSVEEAMHFLEDKYPNYKIRNKIGFVEPEASNGFMLGKIAKVTFVEPQNSNDPILVDYVLYQIDSGKMAEYSKKLEDKIKHIPTDKLPADMKKFSDLQSALKELASLDQAQAKQKPAPAPAQPAQPVQSQPSVSFNEEVQVHDIPPREQYRSEEGRSQWDHNEYERPDPREIMGESMGLGLKNPPKVNVYVTPPRGLVDEMSLDAPMIASNRLGMSIPDRASSTRSHASRESFFW